MEQFINPLPPLQMMPAIGVLMLAGYYIARVTIEDKINNLLTLNNVLKIVGWACFSYVMYNHEIYGF